MFRWFILIFYVHSYTSEYDQSLRTREYNPCGLWAQRESFREAWRFACIYWPHRRCWAVWRLYLSGSPGSMPKIERAMKPARCLRS